MTSPTPTVPGAELLRVIAECADTATERLADPASQAALHQLKAELCAKAYRLDNPAAPVPVNKPFDRVPQCACDIGTGAPPTTQQRLECKVRGGPCANRDRTLQEAAAPTLGEPPKGHISNWSNEKLAEHLRRLKDHPAIRASDTRTLPYALELAADRLSASPPRGGDGAGGMAQGAASGGQAEKASAEKQPVSIPPLPPPAEAGEPTRVCPGCGLANAVGCRKNELGVWDRICNCGWAGPGAMSLADATVAWNRRAQPIPGAGEGSQWPEYIYGAPPAPDMLEKLRAASGQPERAPQSPPPTESSGPHGSPPPATGEVGALVAEWQNDPPGGEIYEAKARKQRLGDRLAAALADLQKRSLEDAQDCELAAKQRDAAEAALATAREEIDGLMQACASRDARILRTESELKRAADAFDKADAQCATLTTSLDQARAVVEASLGTFTDAAQFFDGVKGDAVKEGWWTPWDQSVRDAITERLKELYAVKGA